MNPPPSASAIRAWRLDHLLAAGILGLMALIAFANVLSRYLFHYSISFTEELTVHLFVWLTLMGSAIAFERGSHLGLVFFLRFTPPRMRRAAIWTSFGCATALFLGLAVLLLQTIWQERSIFHAASPAFGFPLWYYYAVVLALIPFVFRGIWRGTRQALAQTRAPAAPHRS